MRACDEVFDTKTFNTELGLGKSSWGGRSLKERPEVLKPYNFDQNYQY